jgi:hypothetical protein
MYASPPRQGGNGPAVLVGFGAMFAGAAVWTVITVATKHDYQIVAMLVGAVVGGAMFLTSPTRHSVALAAGFFAFLGCAIGEFFVVGWLASHDSGGSISLVPMLKFEAKHPADVYWDHVGGLVYLCWFSAAAIAVILTVRRVARVGQNAQRAYGIAPSFGGPVGVVDQGYGPPVRGYPGQGYPAQGGFGGEPQGWPGYGPPQGGPGYGPPQGQPPYPQGRG